MANVTAGKTFSSGEVVTPESLNNLGLPTVTVADGEVTTAKLATGAVTADKMASTLDLSSKTMSLPASVATPVGAVMAFAMNSVPTGWLACNGAAVSRTTYVSLYNAIGTTYGEGDSTTTFNLPDLRGYFVRGGGTNGDGTESGTFGAKQTDGIRDHSHRWQYMIAPLDTGLVSIGNVAGGGAFNYDIPMVPGTSAAETRPKNIAMLYCIKF